MTGAAAPRHPHRSHPLRRVLVGLAAAGCLTGCGVQPSDVIDAGPPAQGVVVPASYRYFVLAGRVRAIPSDPELARKVMAAGGLDFLPPAEPGGDGAPGQVGPPTSPEQLPPTQQLIVALRELVVGPGPAERQLGVTTAIPSGTGRIAAKMSEASVEVFVFTDVRRLSPIAVTQIACTATSVRRGQSAGWRGPIGLLDDTGGQREVPPCPEADLTALPMAGHRSVG